MIEQLKRLGVGVSALAVVGTVAAGILTLIAYLIVCHPNWLMVIVFLLVGWLVGVAIRSDGNDGLE